MMKMCTLILFQIQLCNMSYAGKSIRNGRDEVPGVIILPLQLCVTCLMCALMYSGLDKLVQALKLNIGLILQFHFVGLDKLDSADKAKTSESSDDQG